MIRCAQPPDIRESSQPSACFHLLSDRHWIGDRSFSEIFEQRSDWLEPLGAS